MVKTLKRVKKVKAVKIPRKKVGPDPFILILVSCVILLLTMIAALVVSSYKQIDTVGKYEILELIDNQACRYLDHQPEVNGSFNLDVDAPKDKPKLSYTCTNGQKVNNPRNPGQNDR
jgi:competence protein ComGC